MNVFAIKVPFECLRDGHRRTSLLGGPWERISYGAFWMDPEG
jgi:hypothetical protein